jgi:gamma-glutamylcyclotransferase (GGCT)/AIG2-like uncharacterized protein YtfP
MTMSATPEPVEQLPFFVYGTLLPGQPNAHLWAGAVVAQEVRVGNGRFQQAWVYVGQGGSI